MLAKEGLVAYERDLEVFGAVLSRCARRDTHRHPNAGRDLRVASPVDVLWDSSGVVDTLAIHGVIGMPLVPDLPRLHDPAIICRLKSLMLNCRY